VQAEIENQKRYLAKTLKTIREYPLGTGSDMAFTFVPMRPQGEGNRRGRARSGAKPR
jgi:hypothetical protein